MIGLNHPQVHAQIRGPPAGAKTLCSPPEAGTVTPSDRPEHAMTNSTVFTRIQPGYFTYLYTQLHFVVTYSYYVKLYSN